MSYLPCWGKMCEINQISLGVSVSCHLLGWVALEGSPCVLAMQRAFQLGDEQLCKCEPWKLLESPVLSQGQGRHCLADLQPLLVQISMNALAASPAGSTPRAKSHSGSHVWCVLTFILGCSF